MSNFFNELKRRHVVKAGLAYLAISWMLTEVATVLLPLFEVPDIFLKGLVIFLAVGFPIWLIIAWVYDFTPEGLKKTEEVPFDAKVSAKKNLQLNRVIIGGLSIAVVFLIANTFRLSNKIEFEEDGRLTLAVLPFDNFSPDPSNEWIGDGITEDLLTQLSKIDTFRVISRTSVMRYKNADMSIPEIAKELGASYIVEGSVRVAGDDIIMTAQLVDKSDKHLWAENYREKGGDVFDMQHRVAMEVSANLLGTLTPGQKNELEAVQDIDPEARKYLVWGNRVFDKMDIAAQPKAKKYYKTAHDIEPRWAAPIAALAYMEAFNNAVGADSLANRALSINPKLDQAQAAKAVSMNRLESHPKAIEMLEAYVTDFPNSPWSLDYLASLYIDENFPEWHKPDKAYEYATQAVKLNPNSQIFARKQIMALLQMGEFEKADSIIQLKTPIFDEGITASLESFIIWEKARYKSHQAKDYKEAIRVLHDAVKNNSTNRASYLHDLALVYIYYFNDKENFLKYARQAWENRDALIESDENNLPEIINSYSWSLHRNKKYDEARKFLESEDVQKVYAEATLHGNEIDWAKFWFYIAVGEFDAAAQYIKEEPYLELIHRAAKGDHKGAFELMKDMEDNVAKAEVFALLDIRDSVFNYINKNDIDIRWINSQFMFDPFRQDPRFIAFREKYFLEDVSIE